MILILNIALSLPLQTLATTPQSLRFEVKGSVSREGKPVKDAVVHFLRRKLPLAEGRLSMASEVVETRVKTDQYGEFKLDLAAWRKYSAYARKGQLISEVSDKIDLLHPSVDFVLSPMKAVMGKLQYRGKAPGREIPIRLCRVSGEALAVPVAVSSLANEDGSFRLPDLPHGRWQLMLGSPARRLAKMIILENGNENSRIELQRAISLDCRLDTSGKGNGEPIAGAKIQLLDGLQFFETETDATGMFKLQGLQTGPGATFLVEASGHRLELMALEPGLSPRDKSPQGELMIRKGREIRGKAVGLDGKPLAGIGVLLFAKITRNGLPNPDLSLFMQSGADGTFSTNEADPGSVYELQFVLPDGEPQYLRDIAPGNVGPDFGSFKVGAKRARARVKIPKDVQAADVEVRIYGSKESGAFLDYKPLLPMPDGSYLSPTMPEGEYLLVALSKSPGLARGRVQLRQRAKPVLDVELTIAKPRLISGRLEDGAGNPLKGYHIRILQSGSSAAGGSRTWTNIAMERITEDVYPVKEHPRHVTTDDKGRFSMTCYEASGQYDLIVSTPDDKSGGQDALLRITNVNGRTLPLKIVVK